MKGRFRIIGVGNPLMGDDGLGIAAAERLQKMELPPGVEVIDGGTGGITLLGLMEGARRVLFLDAVEMGRPPGTVARFSLEEILACGEGESGLSLHETGLPQVLALGRELGALPPLALFGVQPESVEPRLGLSPAAEKALPHLLERVLAEVAEPAPVPHPKLTVDGSSEIQ